VMPGGGWFIGDVSPATNLPHGIGTHFGPTGVEIASGEWNEGALHGDGSATLPTGELYSGSFSHGLRHGHGRCTWPEEQTTYEGMWSEGRMSGVGRQELPDGSAFEGTFATRHVQMVAVLCGTDRSHPLWLFLLLCALLCYV